MFVAKTQFLSLLSLLYTYYLRKSVILITIQNHGCSEEQEYYIYRRLLKEHVVIQWKEAGFEFLIIKLVSNKYLLCFAKKKNEGWAGV